jgi:hypothetical protein
MRKRYDTDKRMRLCFQADKRGQTGPFQQLGPGHSV